MTTFKLPKSTCTVEPPIMDTPKSGQFPYNGHTAHPLPMYIVHTCIQPLTTSEQWTMFSSPMCPLFRGSTIFHGMVYLAYAEYYHKVERIQRYVCKWKNHFYETKGEVGMSWHEKGRQQEVAYTKTESNS